MPELPDLVHIEAKLRAAVRGRKVLDARTGDPTVLRIMVREPFPQLLVGRTLREVSRRGHFMLFELDDDLVLAVNAMLAGRYFLAGPDQAKAPRALGLALLFEGDIELRYVDDKRMGKVYVARPEDLSSIPQLGTLGMDLLSPTFTRDAFRTMARRRRDQVRQFLMDKTVLASIGNAYADEILFAAKLHPKTFCPKLAPEDVDRLYQAIGSVLRNAIDEIGRRDEPTEVKVRDFLLVRGRVGEPCPVCATTIRSVRVGDGDACFCPQCQPPARKLFVDWSKLPPGGSGQSG